MPELVRDGRTREDALCLVTERAMATSPSPQPQSPTPVPQGLGTPREWGGMVPGQGRQWQRRGQPEPRIGRILPPCPENKGLGCKGSGGRLITSGTRRLRAAELPPESRRAGTGTPLLEIIRGASSGCFEIRRGEDTGWWKKTPSCSGLPGWGSGAVPAAAGEMGRRDAAQGVWSRAFVDGMPGTHKSRLIIP